MESPLLGPIFLDIVGTELKSNEIQHIQHSAVGGVILFSRNYASRTQLAELVQQIQSIRTPPVLVAVDQEGGRVQRFREEFTRLPAAAHALSYCDGDLQKACQITQEMGWLMAAELRSVGVDFSFAPVLDLDYGLSTVIGDRAFGQTIDQVSQLATAWMLGAREAGMISVGKHFPGHGAVMADSHLSLPVDERNLDTIVQADVQPFQQLIAQGLDAIMPAHVLYSACDQQLAGFSHFWLQEILRKKLGFQGVIFSDDLSMQATNQVSDYWERTQLALAAGCDSVLVCNAPEAVEQILGEMRTPVSGYAKLMRLYARPCSLTYQQLRLQARWQKAVDLAEKITT